MDHYACLGLSKTATQEEIRQAYKKLARIYHPDRNHEAEAKSKFQQVSEAYETLSDPVKKAEYDQIISNTVIEKELTAARDLYRNYVTQTQGGK